MSAIGVAAKQNWLECLFPRRDGRYLTVTAVAALSAVAGLFYAAPSPWLWPALGGFSIWSSLISAGDAVTQRIPNLLNLAALCSAWPLLALATAAGPGSLSGAGMGAAAAFFLYLALWLVAPTSIGMGDVKLAPYLGAHLGYFGLSCWWHGLFYGLIVQGGVAGIGLAAGKLRRGDRVAHGPAMCLGAAAALLEALLGR